VDYILADVKELPGLLDALAQEHAGAASRIRAAS
jgi:hypothetical protein